jgi:hypothetical protein
MANGARLELISKGAIAGKIAATINAIAFAPFLWNTIYCLTWISITSIHTAPLFIFSPTIILLFLKRIVCK